MKKKGKRIGIVLSIVMILVMMMSVTSNAAMIQIIELDYTRSNDSITISRESILSGEVTQSQLSIIYNTIRELEAEAEAEEKGNYIHIGIKTLPAIMTIGDSLNEPYCVPAGTTYEIYLSNEITEYGDPIIFQNNKAVNISEHLVQFALYKSSNGNYYALVYDSVKEMLTNITEVDSSAENYNASATFYFEEKSLVTEATSGMGTILGWIAKPFNALINGGWNSLLVLFAVGIAISGVLIAVKIIRKFIWGD